MTEPEELIDDNGYPTEEALNHLKAFRGTGAEMIDYIRSLMNNGASKVEDSTNSYGLKEHRLTLWTHGWSGCEEVIAALRGTMFHLMSWESSHRGGMHTFTLNPQQLDLVMPWGDLDPSGTQKS